MKPIRIATLAIAAILTTLATVGTIDHWPLAEFLRSTAIAAWVIFAGATGTEQILDAIDKARADINTYGDRRHDDGLVDGMHRVPPQPGLQRVR